MQKRVAFLAYSFALCLGLLISSAVSVNATDNCGWLPATISGTVTAYDQAQCGHEGSITIAGIKFRIPSGIDLTFVDPACNVEGVTANCRVLSAAQIIGTGRRIDIYLDFDGNIRLVRLSRLALPLPNSTNTGIGTGQVGPTTARSFSMAGRTTAVNINPDGSGTIVINGITFPLAENARVDPKPGSEILQLTGTFNANNELTSVVVENQPAFRKVLFCGMPAGGFSQTNAYINNVPAPGAGFGGMIYEGPQTFVVSGNCLNEFVCYHGPGQIPFGLATLIAAPGAPIVNRFWTYKNMCYELVIDQFNWVQCITPLPESQINADNLICGQVTAYTPSTPTGNGALGIGNFNLVIAPGHSITNSGVLRVRNDVCVIPNFCEGVSSSPGKLVPAPAFSLLDGSVASQN